MPPLDEFRYSLFLREPVGYCAPQNSVAISREGLAHYLFYAEPGLNAVAIGECWPSVSILTFEHRLLDETREQISQLLPWMAMAQFNPS